MTFRDECVSFRAKSPPNSAQQKQFNETTKLAMDGLVSFPKAISLECFWATLNANYLEEEKKKQAKRSCNEILRLKSLKWLTNGNNETEKKTRTRMKIARFDRTRSTYTLKVVAGCLPADNTEIHCNEHGSSSSLFLELASSYTFSFLLW